MIKLKTGTFDLSGIRKSAPQKTETNKHKLFNTSFEMAMRILLLTSCLPEMCFSRTRLVVLDFMSCYAKNFDLLSRNLHGDNDFMYAEMASRQSLVVEAIKKLVRQEILEVRIDKGYFYKITNYGIQLSSKFSSTYAKEYCTAAALALQKYGYKSDEKLLNIIHTRSIKNIKE